MRFLLWPAWKTSPPSSESIRGLNIVTLNILIFISISLTSHKTERPQKAGLPVWPPALVKVSPRRNTYSPNCLHRPLLSLHDQVGTQTGSAGYRMIGEPMIWSWQGGCFSSSSRVSWALTGRHLSVQVFDWLITGLRGVPPARTSHLTSYQALWHNPIADNNTKWLKMSKKCP